MATDNIQEQLNRLRASLLPSATPTRPPVFGQGAEQTMAMPLMRGRPMAPAPGASSVSYGKYLLLGAVFVVIVLYVQRRNSRCGPVLRELHVADVPRHMANAHVQRGPPAPPSHYPGYNNMPHAGQYAQQHEAPHRSAPSNDPNFTSL